MLFSGLGILPILKELKWVVELILKLHVIMRARHYHVSCELIRVEPGKDCKKLSSCNDHEDCMKLDTSS